MIGVWTRASCPGRLRPGCGRRRPSRLDLGRDLGLHGVQGHRQETHQVGEDQGRDAALSSRPVEIPKTCRIQHVQRVVEKREGDQDADGDDDPRSCMHAEGCRPFARLPWVPGLSRTA